MSKLELSSTKEGKMDEVSREFKDLFSLLENIVVTNLGRTPKIGITAALWRIKEDENEEDERIGRYVIDADPNGASFSYLSDRLIILEKKRSDDGVTIDTSNILVLQFEVLSCHPDSSAVMRQVLYAAEKLFSCSTEYACLKECFGFPDIVKTMEDWD